jgi:hypothetical protein
LNGSSPINFWYGSFLAEPRAVVSDWSALNRPDWGAMLSLSHVECSAVIFMALLLFVTLIWGVNHGFAVNVMLDFLRWVRAVVESNNALNSLGAKPPSQSFRLKDGKASVEQHLALYVDDLTQLSARYLACPFTRDIVAHSHYCGVISVFVVPVMK